MRRLHKAAVPDILNKKRQEWTTEFNQSPDGFSRYRHPDIKVALEEETHGKCAYCESRIEDVAPVHVEHILPKSKHPELVVDWDNLTLACPKCNYNKGDYWIATAPLLHPYNDDPDLHLAFTGSLIFASEGSELGERTIKRVKLDRDALRQSREERLKSLSLLLNTYHRAKPEDKEMYLDLIRDEVSSKREYSVAAKKWMHDMGLSI